MNFPTFIGCENVTVADLRYNTYKTHKDTLRRCYSGTSSIHGFVDVVGSLGPFKQHEWSALRHRHCVPREKMPYGGNTCGWVRENPQRLQQPMKVARDRGAVWWQSVSCDWAGRGEALL